MILLMISQEFHIFSHRSSTSGGSSRRTKHCFFHAVNVICFVCLFSQFWLDFLGPTVVLSLEFRSNRLPTECEASQIDTFQHFIRFPLRLLSFWLRFRQNVIILFEKSPLCRRIGIGLLKWDYFSIYLFPLSILDSNVDEWMNVCGSVDVFSACDWDHFTIHLTLNGPTEILLTESINSFLRFPSWMYCLASARWISPQQSVGSR